MINSQLLFGGAHLNNTPTANVTISLAFFFLKKKREKYEELLRSRSFIEKDKTSKKDVLIN